MRAERRTIATCLSTRFVESTFFGGFAKALDLNQRCAGRSTPSIDQEASADHDGEWGLHRQQTDRRWICRVSSSHHCAFRTSFSGINAICSRDGQAGGDRGYELSSGAYGGAYDRYLFRSGCRLMIDTLSLLLSHILMLFVMFKVVNRPALNVEPTDSGRHFKTVGPRA
jgi:hypothetical protein